jgi:phosphoglycolate phosphatase
MKLKYDLVVFDWDGTLMDSEARIVDCMQLAAADIGEDVPGRAEARDIIGLGLEQAVARLFPHAAPARVGELVDAYRRHWLGDEVEPARMFAGSCELVAELHEAGSLLAVATGKSRKGLDKSLAESGLGGLFHVTRCADEAFSKPHPQMLEEILTDLDTAPQRTIMVGDTEYDMQMASSAGVPAVGVTHGVHSAERLLAHGALQCFDDLFSLAHWLRDH